MSEISSILNQFFNETISPLVHIFNSLPTNVQTGIKVVATMMIFILGFKIFRRHAS